MLCLRMAANVTVRCERLPRTALRCIFVHNYLYHMVEEDCGQDLWTKFPVVSCNVGG